MASRSIDNRKAGTQAPSSRRRRAGDRARSEAGRTALSDGKAGAEVTLAAVQAPAIPPQEMTPAVSLAIKTLQAEIHALHQDLREAKGQIHQLERMADRDALLPVLNRRAFMRELSRIISYVGRYDASACLIFVDLNDFKAVNDRFGHVAGDQALMRVADVLRSRIRESDVLGRLGGDEFGIILVNAGRDIAERKSAILRAMLTDEAVVYEGHSFTIDASFGVWPIDPAAEVESILARADEAMYEIKKARA